MRRRTLLQRLVQGVSHHLQRDLLIILGGTGLLPQAPHLLPQCFQFLLEITAGLEKKIKHFFEEIGPLGGRTGFVQICGDGKEFFGKINK